MTSHKQPCACQRSPWNHPTRTCGSSRSHPVKGLPSVCRIIFTHMWRLNVVHQVYARAKHALFRTQLHLCWKVAWASMYLLIWFDLLWLTLQEWKTPFHSMLISSPSAVFQTLLERPSLPKVKTPRLVVTSNLWSQSGFFGHSSGCPKAIANGTWGKCLEMFYLEAFLKEQPNRVFQQKNTKVLSSFRHNLATQHGCVEIFTPLTKPSESSEAPYPVGGSQGPTPEAKERHKWDVQRKRQTLH